MEKVKIENVPLFEFEIKINLLKVEIDMIKDDLKNLGEEKTSIKWGAIIQSRIDTAIRRIYNGSKKKTFEY